MYLSDKEFYKIMTRLANIDKAEKAGAKKNYISNQVREIRLQLVRAERRHKNTLL